jgi:hypothetical protein
MRVAVIVCVAIFGTISTGRSSAVTAGEVTYEESVLFLGYARADEGQAGAPDPARLIVERDDGESFLLTVEDGCRTLEGGNRVVVREVRDVEGLRALVSDEIRGISCGVIDTRAVTIVGGAPPAADEPNFDALTDAHEMARVVNALQSALSMLGYDPGVRDGEVGPATASALSSYRADKRHDVTGRELRFSIWTLGMDVLIERPRDERALSIADTLFSIAAP